MNIINESSHRSSQEGKSHGVSYTILGSHAPEDSYYGCPRERETRFGFSKTWGPYGAHQAPLPKSIKSVQEEPRLDKKEVYVDKDQKYIDRIKRPLLENIPIDTEEHKCCCLC